MGMSIDKCYLYGSCKCQTAGCIVLPDEGCPVYRYFKDLIIKDYEFRLKAEKITMLEDLKEEIDELPMYYDPMDVSDLIQQKINAIKGNEEGEGQ